MQIPVYSAKMNSKQTFQVILIENLNLIYGKLVQLKFHQVILRPDGKFSAFFSGEIDFLYKFCIYPRYDCGDGQNVSVKIGFWSYIEHVNKVYCKNSTCESNKIF